ncbi:MAG: hypothetical protein V4726_14245 [Verrucomicrobiota bacterium]
MRAPFLLLISGCFVPMLSPLAAQTDDFDDNDDTGWTHFDPIGTATGQPFAAVAVEAGLYHLTSPASPDPAQAGPARVAAYRADQSFTDFVIVVDLVSWDDSLDQAMGILARLQPDPGPGSLKGYSVNYQARDHDIEINRLDNEQPVTLKRVDVNLAPGDAHRLVFTGTGGLLTAAVFSREEPLKPLITLSAEDETYTAGHCGIFIYNADSGGAGPADVTFDTYSASAPAVPGLAISAAPAGVTLEWPRAASGWRLQESPDLSLWTDITTGGGVSGQNLTLTLPAGAPVTGFYRLKEGWPEPAPEPLRRPEPRPPGRVPEP